MRLRQLRPHSPEGGRAPAQLGNSFLSLPLHGERPTLQDSATRQPKGKPLLGAERHQSLGPPLDSRLLTTALMNPCCPVQHIREAVGVRQLLGEGQGSLNTFERPVRIAQTPLSRRP